MTSLIDIHYFYQVSFTKKKKGIKKKWKIDLKLDKI